MDLHLDFARGNMSGEGNDDVGRFLVKGRYDEVSRECYWTKSYVGAHDVFYRGFREGKGIWGIWEISLFAHGGFHIWPRRAGQGEADSESAVQVEPVDAIATEAVTQPAGAMKAEGCARSVGSVGDPDRRHRCPGRQFCPHHQASRAGRSLPAPPLGRPNRGPGALFALIAKPALPCI